MTNLIDYTIMNFDLEKLVIELCNYDFVGENSNQDPCFSHDEDGFENCIYDPKTKKMKYGYTVILTKEEIDDNPSKIRLMVAINFFDNDWNGLGELEDCFNTSKSIDSLQKSIKKMIDRGIKKWTNE